MEEGGLSCEAASLSYEEVVESGQDDEEEMEEGRDIGEGVEGVGPNQVEGTMVIIVPAWRWLWWYRVVIH